MRRSHFYLVLLMVVLSVSCLRLRELDFPVVVDTSDRTVRPQRQQLYPLPELGVSVDDLFAGGKLDACFQRNDSALVGVVEPEQEAYLDHPWYALRIRAQQPRRVTLRLDYRGGKHRFTPRVSRNGSDWTPLPDKQFKVAADSSHLLMNLELSAGANYIAGQEVMASDAVRTWCNGLVQSNPGAVGYLEVGRTAQGKPLMALDIGRGEPKKKPLLVLFCRARPAGVAGFFRLQAFVSALLRDNALSDAFLADYRVLVFPLLNPDGADLGHWLANTNGADLQYDWGSYRQPEVRMVAEYLVEIVKSNRHQMTLALDFQSGRKEAYLLANPEGEESEPSVGEQWIKAVWDTRNVQPFVQLKEGGDTPEPSNWASRQFGAQGIRLISADNSDRTELAQKGAKEARELMKYLTR